MAFASWGRTPHLPFCMTALSVNVNKIALLRNARVGKGPDVVHLARLALRAGAHGITVHPRPDERHITRADTRDLAAMVREEFPDAEYNIESLTDSLLVLTTTLRGSDFRFVLVPAVSDQ